MSAHKKISITGLTAFQVAQWMQTLTPNPKVSRLVIHVGVNDCKGGEICTEQWSSLLSLCRSRFPSSTVIASSIIPARGRHPINSTIAKSNDNLKSVCRQHHVTYVDHHDTFVARSQAPKKVLYDNALHPSRQCLLKLARNIKYPNANVSQSQGKEGRNHRPCPPPPTLQATMPSHLCHPGPSQPYAVSPPAQSPPVTNSAAASVLRPRRPVAALACPPRVAALHRRRSTHAPSTRPRGSLASSLEPRSDDGTGSTRPTSRPGDQLPTCHCSSSASASRGVLV